MLDIKRRAGHALLHTVSFLSSVACLPAYLPCACCMLSASNGNASETKANESFDNGVFFDIEAKRTPSTVRKLFSKRSEHIR